MDNLTRWAIGLGAGIFTGMLILGGHYAATAGANYESFSNAVDRLIPDYTTLDAVIAADTFNARTYTDLVTTLHEVSPDWMADCGGYLNPAHVCTIDGTIPDALHLSSVTPSVIRDSYALTVGEYRSDYEDLLRNADTVLVDTGTGLRPVTYEGNGTFTLGYLGSAPATGENKPWQFALAAVPVVPVWLTVGAVAAIISVLVAACFRPQREPEVEEVGVEFFDILREG